MDYRRLCISSVFAVILVGSTFCAPVDHSIAKRGVVRDAIIGAIGGAVVGALVPGMDAKQGAAAGAALGAGYGYYQDRKQKKKVQQQQSQGTFGNSMDENVDVDRHREFA